MLTYNNLSLLPICPCSTWLGFVIKISIFQTNVWKYNLISCYLEREYSLLWSQSLKEVHTYHCEFSRSFLGKLFSVIQLCLCDIFFNFFRRSFVKCITITSIIWNLIAHQILKNTWLSKISKQMLKIFHGDDSFFSGPENGDVSYMKGFIIPHNCTPMTEST